MIRKEQSVNGVVIIGKKVLLVKRRDVPVWVLPGGGLEENESPEEATIREVFEESGYHVKITKKIAEYTPLNRLTRFTHVFECEVIGGKPTTSDESSAVNFFHHKKLPKKTPPPYPDWIKDAFSHQKKLIQKPITSVTYRVLIWRLITHPLLVIRFLLSRIGLHIQKR